MLRLEFIKRNAQLLQCTGGLVYLNVNYGLQTSTAQGRGKNVERSRPEPTLKVPA